MPQLAVLIGMTEPLGEPIGVPLGSYQLPKILVVGEVHVAVKLTGRPLQVTMPLVGLTFTTGAVRF